jgi:hypothetical protein
MTLKNLTALKIGIKFSIISVIVSFIGFSLMLFSRAFFLETSGMLPYLLGYILLLPSILFIKFPAISLLTVFLIALINSLVYLILGFLVNVKKEGNNETINLKFYIKLLVIFIIIPLIFAGVFSYLSSRCDLIKSSSESAACFYGLASEKSDPSICYNLPKDLIHAGEFTECITRVAIKLSDASVCNLITNPIYIQEDLSEQQKEICISYVAESEAEKTGDSSGCDLIINNSDNKNYCLSVANRNPSLCSQIANEANKDFCYSHVAFLNKNKEICNKISNEGIRDECLQNIK